MSEMVRLGDVATYVNGYAFKPSDWSDNGVPIIRIQDLTGNSYQSNYYNGSVDTKYEIKKGDILISWSASLGVYVWQGETAVLNQHIFKVVFDKVDVDVNFFRHQVEKILQNASSAAHGATMKHLTKPVFDSLPFNYPPLSEQHHIAAILDKVSELVALRKKQLDLLDEMVKARFVEMFGDPVRNPKNLPTNQLSNYILFLTSGSRGWAKYCNDTGKEWFITIKNCNISTDNMQNISPPDNAEARRTKVQEGDLLISITADLGRTGVVTKEIAAHGAYINQHLTCIRINRSILNPIYVAYYMESEAGKQQFETQNQTGVKAGLNFNSINGLKLMIPNIDEQNQFDAFVQEINKSKATVQQGLDRLNLLKSALMQEYFG